jgi:hypothetical protein
LVLEENARANKQSLNAYIVFALTTHDAELASGLSAKLGALEGALHGAREQNVALASRLDAIAKQGVFSLFADCEEFPEISAEAEREVSAVQNRLKESNNRGVTRGMVIDAAVEKIACVLEARAAEKGRVVKHPRVLRNAIKLALSRKLQEGE